MNLFFPELYGEHMKHLIILILSLNVTNAFTQSIDEHVVDYYQSAHIPFDKEIIVGERISEYCKKIQQLESDSITYEQEILKYYFDSLGYIKKTIARNNYFGYDDSLVTNYYYDSLHRLTEVNKFEPSRNYPYKYGFTERNIWLYDSERLVTHIKIGLTNNNSRYSSRNDQLRITKIEDVTYLNDSTARIETTPNKNNLPDSLRAYYYQPYTNHILLLTASDNGILKVSRERSGSRIAQYKDNSCGHLREGMTASPIYQFLTSNYLLDACVPHQLAISFDSKDSLILVDSLIGWYEGRINSKNSSNLEFDLSPEFSGHNWFELDTTNHLLYLFSKSSMVYHKSGPSEFVTNRSISIFDCSNNLRLSKVISHVSTSVDQSFYGEPFIVESINTNDSISTPFNYQSSIYTTTNVIQDDYDYYTNGLLHSKTTNYNRERNNFISREFYSIKRF